MNGEQAAWRLDHRVKPAPRWEGPEGEIGMSESAELVAALLGQVAKAARSFTDDEIKRLASGDAKLAVVSSTQRIIDSSPAIDSAVKMVRQLGQGDLRQIEEKTAKLALLRKGDKIVSAFNAPETADQVSKLRSEAEIVRFLDEDPRLNAQNLKRVAAELSVIVPPSVKSKPALQLHIAQSVVRDRDRSSWR
jgi:hypothetical protein